MSPNKTHSKYVRPSRRAEDQNSHRVIVDIVLLVLFALLFVPIWGTFVVVMKDARASFSLTCK